MYIIYSIFLFQKSCHLSHNMEKYDIARRATDGTVIRLACFACWIKQTRVQTHTKYVTHCFSTATMVTRTHLRVTFYTLSVFLVHLETQYVFHIPWLADEWIWVQRFFARTFNNKTESNLRILFQCALQLRTTHVTVHLICQHMYMDTH